MNAKESVKRCIAEHKLIDRGDILVLGLSGGPDSMCLFDILSELKTELGFCLFALHFNHCVRGAQADKDEEFLKEYCKAVKTELKTVKEDIPALAKDLGLSVEEAGRKRRQQCLADYCKELKERFDSFPDSLPSDAPGEALVNARNKASVVKVVLAHNADDQAETVLLRLLRGTGVHGLAAMRFKREDGLIRPLLSTPRSEIEGYCKARGLEPRIDSTNLSVDYLRNRIRLELLPELAEINPNIKNTLVRLAENAAQDDDFLTSEAGSRLSDKDKGLFVKELREMPEAIFHRVIKLKFAQIGLSEDISSVHINALKSCIIRNIGNKTVEFPNGYRAYINHGVVEFLPPEK